MAIRVVIVDRRRRLDVLDVMRRQGMLARAANDVLLVPVIGLSPLIDFKRIVGEGVDRLTVQ
jgi:hypothetical protein